LEDISNGCQIYFLNGILEEEVYVEQLAGYVVKGKDDKVY